MNNPTHLARGDRQLLAGFGIIIFLLAGVTSPQVGLDGAVLVQTTREMNGPTGDWLIPTLGGMPFLERAPFAQWFAAVVSGCCGTQLVLPAMRLCCMLAVIVLSVSAAGIGARLFGRRVGLLSGLTTMTTVSMVQAVGATSADLLPAMSLVLCLHAFLNAELGARHAVPIPERLPRSLWSSRRREIVMFFTVATIAAMLCGLTVLTLGLVVPVAAFVASSRQIAVARRYAWLWGAAAIVCGACLWPLAVIYHEPMAIAVWCDRMAIWNWLAGFRLSHMEQRLANGVALAFTLSVSWGLLAPAGLWFTRHEAMGSKQSPERVLWMFAVVAPLCVVLMSDQPRSVLLASVVTWNVLASVGIERTITWAMQVAQRWLVDVRINLPLPTFPVSRVSIASAFLIFAAVYVPVIWTNSTGFQAADTQRLMLMEVLARLPHRAPVAVDMEMGDDAVLALFELKERGAPLHNLSFVLDESLPASNLLVLTRRRGQQALSLVGRVDEIVSAQSMTATSDDELTLFRVQLAPQMARLAKAEVGMSFAQATRREPGPWLSGWQLSSRADIRPGYEAVLMANEPAASKTRR